MPSDLTSVATISAGANHTCALRIDGTVVCWGDNGWGQTSGPTGVDLTPDQPQTISFTSVAPNPGIVGTPYTVAATGGGSGNEVVFSVPFTGSVCTVTGSTVTFLAHGTCTIAADQAAGPGFLAATQVTQSFDVLASQDVRFVSVAPDPGVTGTTYTLSAQGTASGNAVTFSSLTATVCSVEGSVATLSQAGTCTVAADQAAGNGYAAAPQATQTFTVVEPQPQSIHFTSQPPDRAIVGGSYTVIATGGNSGNEVFFNSLTPTVCLAMGSDVTFLKIGTCRIAAGQNGNTFYFPAPNRTRPSTSMMCRPSRSRLRHHLRLLSVMRMTLGRPVVCLETSSLSARSVAGSAPSAGTL